MPISTASEAGDIAEALVDSVRRASAAGAALRIVGGDTKAFLGRATAGEPLNLAGHTGIVAYDPSELVITARAGTAITAIETVLAEHGQMLGFEPPVFGPASTLGGVVAAGLSGPRRPFAGGVRDFVLGVKILDGAGQTLRFGGTVFKNVAGFDAFRLMAGSLGCLGVLLEVSLRVSPAPRAEVCRSFNLDWSAASGKIASLMRRPFPLTGAFHDGARLHLRVAGGEAAVDEAASELGGEASPASLWDDIRHMRLGVLAAPRLWRLTVPRTAVIPDLVGEMVHDWAGGQRWLVSDASADTIRAAAIAVGGHASLFRGARDGEAVFAPLPESLFQLHRRLKAAFDPAGVFNPGRMYGGL